MDDQAPATARDDGGGSIDAAAAERYARLARALDVGGIDALLLSRWTHGVLVSGARRVQVGGSGGGAPWVVVTRGRPAPIVFTTDPDGRPPWLPVECVRPFAWDPESLVRQIADLVRESRRGVVAGTRIAYDVLSVAMLERLGGALPGARFEDAGDLLYAARGPKSAAEIERLADAAAKAERATVAAGLVVTRGGSGRSAVAAAYRQMSADGVGFPLAEVEVSALRIDGRRARLLRYNDAPSGRFFVVVDVALSVGGVAGRCIRTFLHGLPAMPPGDTRTRDWRRAVDGLRAVACPGATPGAMRTAAVDTVIPPGGLLAHGLGVGIEPPYVTLDEEVAAGGIAGEASGAEAVSKTERSPAGSRPSAAAAGPASTALRVGDVLLLAPCVADAGGEIWSSVTVVVGESGGRRLDGRSELGGLRYD